jgi:hypothetical protein
VITDGPGNQFTEELLDTYPEAIVICTTRDPERWWKSIQPVLDKVDSMAALDLLFLPLPTLRHFGSWIRALKERGLFLFKEPTHKGRDCLGIDVIVDGMTCRFADHRFRLPASESRLAGTHHAAEPAVLLRRQGRLGTVM